MSSVITLLAGLHASAHGIWFKLAHAFPPGVWRAWPFVSIGTSGDLWAAQASGVFILTSATPKFGFRHLCVVAGQVTVGLAQRVANELHSRVLTAAKLAQQQFQSGIVEFLRKNKEKLSGYAAACREEKQRESEQKAQARDDNAKRRLVSLKLAQVPPSGGAAAVEKNALDSARKRRKQNSAPDSTVCQGFPCTVPARNVVIEGVRFDESDGVSRRGYSMECTGQKDLAKERCDNCATSQKTSDKYFWESSTQI